MNFFDKLKKWMFNKVSRDLGVIFALVVPEVFNAEREHGGGTGEAKRAQVVASIKAQIAKEGGIDAPAWVLDALVPFLIDLLLDGVKKDNPGN
ncbi:MAG: hypothetical protein KDH96_04405 [Candidatus Riesia sp.]|nr:hypothetical protein [Candidatus Riesia sp.]